jgi:hypothetical protein
VARPVGLQRIQPAPPDLAALDPAGFRTVYDDVTDTLFIDFHDDRRPAVSVVSGEHVYARVDPETHAMVGIMIEEFLAVIAVEHPDLLDMAVRVGAVTAEQAADAREHISPAREKQVFVHSVLELVST